MNIPSHIFKSYDIRAIYPEEINEENIGTIAGAFHAFFKENFPEKEQLTIVVGRDMRVSSPSLHEALVEALVNGGAKVIDIGIISTPSFYFTVYHYGYDCGIQISASHNPKEYNGLKVVKNSHSGLVKIGKTTGMEQVRQMALEGIGVTSSQRGSVEKKEGILDDEIKNALDLFENPTFSKFKIVADTANAMGAQYIEALFNKIPADLVKMNFELDGTFPNHAPDPLDFNNLVDLQKKVVEEKADFGLAPDGDGDRLFFVDEKGQIIPATLITGLIAEEMLKTNPGATILFDIRYILTPQKVIEENGGKYEITKVGHAFITEKMFETGAIFAGESSAHYFYKSNGNAESQLTTILAILKLLSETGKPLSELAETARRSFESGEFNFRVSNAPEILTQLKEKYKDGELSELDGIAITYPDFRFSVRTSNTEPLLRLNLESTTKESMEEKYKEVKEFIESIAKFAEGGSH